MICQKNIYLNSLFRFNSNLPFVYKMVTTNKDIVIIGGGIVGLSVAHQLIERRITHKITIVDKEEQLGMHTSGRNSGVLHAGIYYKPGTLKAKVCVNGAKRLLSWIKDRNLKVNECGKIIIPTKDNLDSQLDELLERGRLNGAKVELWDEKQLHEFFPQAKSASGRCLWSPNTVVIKPKDVLACLEKDLISKGVSFIKGDQITKVNLNENTIKLTSQTSISFSHLFNCAGLYSDKVAHLFGLAKQYVLLPFKGLYWQVRKDSLIKVPSNLYPVPDLSVPFLGVHFTPSADLIPNISIGPTATLAFGRENYRGLESIEPFMSIYNLSILARQLITNEGGFRRYAREQSLQSFQPFLVRAAQELIPDINANDIEPSQKVGIRAQLFNVKESRLVDDFLCINAQASTHVLNAISPAFSASFELADLILNESNLEKS